MAVSVKRESTASSARVSREVTKLETSLVALSGTYRTLCDVYHAFPPLSTICPLFPSPDQTWNTRLALPQDLCSCCSCARHMSSGLVLSIQTAPPGLPVARDLYVPAISPHCHLSTFPPKIIFDLCLFSVPFPPHETIYSLRVRLLLTAYHWLVRTLHIVGAQETSVDARHKLMNTCMST